MEYVQMVMEHFKDNPSHGVLLAVLLGAVYYALNYRPRVTRLAERRFEELREERGEYYRNMRPPQ